MHSEQSDTTNGNVGSRDADIPLLRVPRKSSGTKPGPDPMELISKNEDWCNRVMKNLRPPLKNLRVLEYIT